MHTSTLATIALLGSAILVSALPACNCDCPVDRSILKSCKDLTFSYKGGRTPFWLKASCQDINEAWNPTSLDLNQVLGNYDAQFVWGGKDFSSKDKNAPFNDKFYEDKDPDSDPDLPPKAIEFTHEQMALAGWDAEDFKLDGKTGVLSATLWRRMSAFEREVNLTDRIENDCGQLKFVQAADAPIAAHI